ncbi:MAG: SIS domain-containing protein [Candidatus Omnitrophota bacterium]
MKPKDEIIRSSVKSLITVAEGLLADDVSASIEAAGRAMIVCLKRGGKILAFGNGGSAADADHFVAELVGRYKKERKGLAAVSLVSNTATITAVSNDYSYGDSFKRQVEALGADGDIAFGISTSGNSPNVIGAVKAAKSLGLTVVALTGCGGGSLAGQSDISIIVPSADTPRVQEAHILIIHGLCDIIDRTVV